MTKADAPPPEITAEQLTGLLREREAAIQTMKGLFRAQIQGPGIPIAQRVEGAMFYRRPDVLRLQGFNRVGGELFEFMLGADLYRLRLPAGQVYTGHAGELERMGNVAQPFRLSVLAVSGVIGIPAIAEQERAVLSMDGDRYRLDVFSDSSSYAGASGPFRRIWFDRRSLQVVQEDRLAGAGEVQATVQFDDYRPVESPAVGGSVPTANPSTMGALVKPFRITAQDGSGKGVLFLTFHEMVPNVPLKPEELKLTGGKGTVMAYLDR
ncbi:MAG: hypothetical protein ICV76_07780 [Nitrospiraceae bacterium]|nr:hypothetical protein [Nitrospiraceae bacterium]